MNFINIYLKNDSKIHFLHFEKAVKISQKCIKLDNFVINRYNTRCCRYEMSK